MFENDIELLREHIEYLKQYLAGDLDEMPSQEELESTIIEFRDDIDTLRGALPYDEIDEDDIPVEDFSEEILQDGELEDELVEAEAVIQELEDLILETESADGSNGSDDSCIDDSNAESSNMDSIMPWLSDILVQTSAVPFNERLTDWIKKTYIGKCEKKGVAIPSEDELGRIAACFICTAKALWNLDKAEEYARENYPDYALSAEEIRKTSLTSAGITHITQEMIKMNEHLGRMLDFDAWIRHSSFLWGDLI